MCHSIIFTVLSVFFLAVLGAPTSSDNQLEARRTFGGRVRWPLDSPSCPNTDHLLLREHGSVMGWVHVVAWTTTPILSSPSQSMYMMGEFTVTK